MILFLVLLSLSSIISFINFNSKLNLNQNNDEISIKDDLSRLHSSGVGWYNSSWSYRKKIAVNHSQVGEVPWFNESWDYRRKISLTTGSSAIPVNYSVSLEFNHSNLVSAGKSQADGDDIRVIYWNGSDLNEIDRTIDSNSTWNSDATKIWFATQAAISASSSDCNYYLYYGNPTANSGPDSGSKTFLFYDGFGLGFDEHPWS